MPPTVPQLSLPSRWSKEARALVQSPGQARGDYIMVYSTWSAGTKPASAIQNSIHLDKSNLVRRQLKYSKDMDNDTHLDAPALEVCKLTRRPCFSPIGFRGSPSANLAEWSGTGEGSNGGGNSGHRRQVRYSNPARAVLEIFSSTFFGLYEPTSV